MKAIIISCGTEIVSGQCLDTNSAWLSQSLTSLGVQVTSHITTGDDRDSLRLAIAGAREQVDLVVITGGLGPTRDDLTREALAGALGVPLKQNDEALVQITEFFRRLQRDMPESNRVQAMIPRGCDVVANPRGTAPGIAYWPTESTPLNPPLSRGQANQNLHLLPEQAAVVALPGVPGEMKVMFQAFVVPRISAIGACTLIARLHCFGISEAKLGEAIADLMTRGRNPSVGTTASQAVLTVRILATAKNSTAAQALLDTDRAEVRRRLGDSVFGEDEETLQGAVAKLLLSAGATVATAESCTGGLLGKMLTDTPGSSGYFLRGYIVYSNQAKSQMLGVPAEVIEQYGAVSEMVARELADRARAQAAADYALSITGVAGPGGGSADKPVGLVYIGLAEAGGVDVRRLLFGEHLTRNEIRDRACRTALNMLRLELLRRPAVH